MPRRFGFGLGFNLSRLTGAIREPSGFVAKYTAYLVDNFNLVTNNQVSQWDDESANANDLTQGTSANQPVLVENDLVTQSTLANQPTFVYDKQVEQSTLANMPTWNESSGVLVFVPSSTFMNTDPVANGEIDFEFDFELTTIGGAQTLVIDPAQPLNYIQTRGALGETFRLNNATDGNLDWSLNTNAYDGRTKLRVSVNGNTAEAWQDDVSLGTQTVNTPSDFSNMINISRNNSSAINGNIYAMTINGASYDPSTNQYMLNDSKQTPSDGDSISTWWATDAVEVVDFEPQKRMDGLTFSLTGDRVIEISLNISQDSVNQTLLTSLSTNSKLRLNTNGNVTLVDDSNANIGFTGEQWVIGQNTIKVVLSGNDASVFVNGVLSGTQNISSNTFSDWESIGTTSGTSNLDASINYIKYWTSADDSGEPDFELLPETQYIPSGIGNPVPKWYATQHNKFDNRVSFDGTDDNMGGLPAQAGDFSYVWRVEHSALSTTDYVFSSSGTPSALVWLSDNYLYLRDTTGAGDIGLTNHTLEAGEHTYALVREGDDIRFYVDSILKQTVDVTGRTYTWDRVGDTADSLLALSEYFYVYNKALTQKEINYFSYLRNNQNEILPPPLLPS